MAPISIRQVKGWEGNKPLIPVFQVFVAADWSHCYGNGWEGVGWMIITLSCCVTYPPSVSAADKEAYLRPAEATETSIISTFPALTTARGHVTGTCRQIASWQACQGKLSIQMYRPTDASSYLPLVCSLWAGSCTYDAKNRYNTVIIRNLIMPYFF